MPELILEATYLVRSTAGVAYQPRVYGQARDDGTWEGWIEFIPLPEAVPTLRTDRETTQSTRAALAYWASGLEPVYYEGALARAQVAA